MLDGVLSPGNMLCNSVANGLVALFHTFFALSGCIGHQYAIKSRILLAAMDSKARLFSLNVST